jgi:hypothetical protein
MEQSWALQSRASPKDTTMVQKSCPHELGAAMQFPLATMKQNMFYPSGLKIMFKQITIG